MTRLTLAAAAMGALLVSGCASVTSQPVPSLPSGAASVATNIVLTVDSDASLKSDYATVQALADSQEVLAAIRGKIVDVKGVYVEHSAYTILTIDVQASRPKGMQGKTITIARDGGVVGLSSVLPDLQGKKDAPPFTANQRATGLVDFRFMGAEQSRQGQEILAFVKSNPRANREIGLDAQYVFVASVHGLFVRESASGRFVRQGDSVATGPVTVAVTDVARFTDG